MNVFNNMAYGLVVGSVRAMEAKLLNFDELLALKACKNVAEFASELKNLNYCVSSFLNLFDFNSKLNACFNGVAVELKERSPSFVPFSLVFFENDCFNLQKIVLLKKRGFSRNSFVLEPGTLSKSSIENFCNGDCQMPEPFTELALELNKLLNSNCSNFEIFNKFNKKKLELKLNLCKANEFLLERTKLEVDIYNCSLALRALKLNLSNASLNEVLVAGGTTDFNLISEAFSKGTSNLSKFFKIVWGFNLNDMLADFYLAEELFFRKISDFDFKMSCLPFNFVAILAYLNKLQWEHRNLKHILTKLISSGGDIVE